MNSETNISNETNMSNEANSTVNARPIISAYITNLGKYNEGALVGKWHGFPTTREEVEKTLREIGIDGVRYEEFFITDYDIPDVDGINKYLGEYASIDEINYLASRIDDLEADDFEMFEAAIESGDYCSNIQDLINLASERNLENCFGYYGGVGNDYDLGYYWVEDSGCYDTKNMGNLTNYIDYERFGRDIRHDEGGEFITNGYIYPTGDSFDKEYDGINVPDEYKVISIPKPEKTPEPVPCDRFWEERDAR